LFVLLLLLNFIINYFIIQPIKGCKKEIISVYSNRMEKNIKKTKTVISPLSMGTIIEGKIVARDRSSIFIDLGVFGTGIIYGKEFYEAKGAIKDLKIGDKISAKIIELENDEGYKELSLKDAKEEIGWEKLKEKKEAGEILKVEISGANKGGLLCSLGDIPAFLPVSQLSPEHYPRITDADKQKIFTELQKFVGKTLEVKILDLSARENKLILSEKAKTLEKAKEILKNYKIGDVVEGEIKGIAGFGAFIKFPLPSETQKAKEKVSIKEDEGSTLEGLIHISELDWQLIEDPSEIVKVDQIVKAKIIDIKNNQVFLSLKSLKKDPWKEIEKKYKKGDVIKGKVIKLSPFGAFIQITPKIRGLCHISEFGTKSKMEEVLKIDEKYNFEILSIDPAEYRIGLKVVK